MRQQKDGWYPFARAWLGDLNSPDKAFPGTETCSLYTLSKAWSMWSPHTLEALSKAPPVESAWALGTVLAINLHDESSAGYASGVAAKYQAQLLDKVGQHDLAIHSRVLGNVMYFMTSLTCTPETVKAVEGALREVFGLPPMPDPIEGDKEDSQSSLQTGVNSP